MLKRTASFRYPSVPNGEKLITELAAKSKGEFSVVMMSGSPNYPDDPQLTTVFQEFMSPAALKNYDGLFFVSFAGLTKSAPCGCTGRFSLGKNSCRCSWTNSHVVARDPAAGRPVRAEPSWRAPVPRQRLHPPPAFFQSWPTA